jgi:hypothetical protein
LAFAFASDDAGLDFATAPLDLCFAMLPFSGIRLAASAR